MSIKLTKAARNIKENERLCPRCSGSGHWVEKHQMCFECRGAGKVSTLPRADGGAK